MQRTFRERAARLACLAAVVAVSHVPLIYAQTQAYPGRIQPLQSLSLVGPGPIGAATTTAQFAHFAVGAGYNTVFTLLNTGDTALTGTLKLTAQDGTPLTVSLTSGGAPVAASEIPLNLNPGGTEFVTAAPLTANDPSLKAGWARVESTGGTLGGVGTFQLFDAGALKTIAGVLSAESVTVATIPVDDDVPANRYTGYAIANPSATDTITVKVQTVKADGSLGATLEAVTLGPGKQTAKFLFQDAAASQIFKGSVVLIEQSGKSFVVVALVQNQGLYTAIPVIPAKAPNIN